MAIFFFLAALSFSLTLFAPATTLYLFVAATSIFLILGLSNGQSV